MVTMTTHLDWPHIRCFALTLQLSVKARLKIKEITNAAVAARKLVGHFKKSSLASNELKSCQKQLDLPQHSLLQDVPTRWNATYIMFERLLEQCLAIFAGLHYKPLGCAILRTARSGLENHGRPNSSAQASTGCYNNYQWYKLPYPQHGVSHCTWSPQESS